MIKSILSSPDQLVLEKALSAASLRHKVISNNIANVNTPNFKKSDVVFEDMLQEAMSPTKPAPVRTHPKHMTGSNAGSFEPSIVTDVTTTLRTDGNNVDIDAEMANMAKNNIYYNAVAQQLSRYFSNIMSAINEGRR